MSPVERDEMHKEVRKKTSTPSTGHFNSIDGFPQNAFYVSLVMCNSRGPTQDTKWQNSAG
eukprot:2583300-Amphidinium_carterae.1